MRRYISRLGTLVILLLSLTWLCRDPGWEPLIAFIFALGIHIGWDGWNAFTSISSHDRLLLDKFRSLIPEDSRKVLFLKNAEWSFPFHHSHIDTLFIIHTEWISADYEFDNHTMRKAWNKFAKANDRLLKTACHVITPHNGNKNIVALDYSNCKTESDRNALHEKLRSQTSDLFARYQEFVRVTRRAIWRAEQSVPGYPPQGVGSPEP